MPSYTIVLSRKAQKQLDQFTDTIANPILDAIAGLQEDARPYGCKKLRDRKDTGLDAVTIGLFMKFWTVS